MYSNGPTPPSPHAGCAACASIVPVPQQTVPGVAAQSSVPSQSHRVDAAIGHALLAATQVDVVFDVAGGSQQWSPAGHVSAAPPSTPLNGQ